MNDTVQPGLWKGLRAVAPKKIVAPMQHAAEGVADVVGEGTKALGRAVRPVLGNAGKVLERSGETIRQSWPLGHAAGPGFTNMK
jgi:hypothetical protein